MQDSADYRVFNRKAFVVIMVILLSLLTVGTWTGLNRLADYSEKLEARIAANPAEAEAILTQLLQTIAIINGLVLSLFAALIIWHGSKGWRTASMPPKGSWILEGQRTWSGESAVRVAKFTIAIGAILAVLAVMSSWMLWGMGDTFLDQTAHPA
jgi:hypothetical protein